MKKRVLVLTDNMPWGHRSIARAIYDFLRDKEKLTGKIKVDYVAVEQTSDIANDLYTFLYRFLPRTTRMTHKLMKNSAVLGVVKDLANMNLPQIKKVINKYKPDLVISTYFFHSHTLALWKKEEADLKFKLWTVVADPWTITQTSFVPGADMHLVYDTVAYNEAVKAGIEPEKIAKTGWWVRPSMYEKYSKEKIRQKLGFRDERPIVFVGGGSLGTNSLPRFLPVLLIAKKKVGVIFNTGTDKLSYQIVDKYCRLLKTLKRDNIVQVKNLGWIENMAEVLSAADIVFGKAGPNFLFDVVAVGRPFVAITHIGGQEDGNIDLIREKKLGWVKEKNGKMAKFFLKYLKNSQYYNEKYLETIKQEANRNKQSLGKVWSLLEKVLE